MSKMSDMAATIEELRTAAAAINDAANWLAEMFSGVGDVESSAPVEPALTLEQVERFLQISPARVIPQRSAPCSRSMVPPSCPRSTPPTTRHCLPMRRC